MSVQEKTTRGSSAAAPRKVRFNVGSEYQIVDVIGEGAYGVVVSAIHRPSNTRVAIKKIAPFDHSMFALRTLRELKLLKYFAEEGSIDVWSIGCILAEMLSGKPIFPGKDYHHQLSLILDVLGTPTIDEFYAITSRRSKEYIRTMSFRKKRAFETLYPKANPLAIDFLTKTLTFDPRKRYTVEQCLEHPYLDAYHDPEDEPTAKPLDQHFFDFDLYKDEISREQLRRMLYDEIVSFQRP
ncbi:unnamed protein product [Cutaneotrichosporon oleaginosum]